MVIGVRFSRGDASRGRGKLIGAECCLRGTGRGMGEMMIDWEAGFGSDLQGNRRGAW